MSLSWPMPQCWEEHRWAAVGCASVRAVVTVGLDALPNLAQHGTAWRSRLPCACILLTLCDLRAVCGAVGGSLYARCSWFGGFGQHRDVHYTCCVSGRGLSRPIFVAASCQHFSVHGLHFVAPCCTRLWWVCWTWPTAGHLAALALTACASSQGWHQSAMIQGVGGLWALWARLCLPGWHSDCNIQV